MNFMLRFSYKNYPAVDVCTPAVTASNQAMSIHVCGYPSHTVGLTVTD